MVQSSASYTTSLLRIPLYNYIYQFCTFVRWTVLMSKCFSQQKLTLKAAYRWTEECRCMNELMMNAEMHVINGSWLHTFPEVQVLKYCAGFTQFWGVKHILPWPRVLWKQPREISFMQSGSYHRKSAEMCTGVWVLIHCVIHCWMGVVALSNDDSAVSNILAVVL